MGRVILDSDIDNIGELSDIVADFLKQVSHNHRLTSTVDIFPAFVQTKLLLLDQDLAQVFQDQYPVCLSNIKSRSVICAQFTEC
jgi:hypothetical protein